MKLISKVEITCVLGICVALTGCASFQFPKLSGEPERPSVKSSWKEKHTQEIDFPALFAAMKAYEQTGQLPDSTIYKKEDSFGVDHQDSRPPQKNVFQKFFGWLAGLGALGILYFYLPAGLLSAGVIAFVKRALLWRKALFQTVAGIASLGDLNKQENAPVHAVLVAKQDEDVKKFVYDVKKHIKKPV